MGLAPHGPTWPLMAQYGPFGSLWHHVAPYGTIWRNMTAYCLCCFSWPLWPHTVPYGTMWGHEGPYGPYWAMKTHIVPCGPIWHQMAPHHRLWPHMCPYVPIWGTDSTMWHAVFAHVAVYRRFVQEEFHFPSNSGAVVTLMVILIYKLRKPRPGNGTGGLAGRRTS